jgi:hypothetical protein
MMPLDEITPAAYPVDTTYTRYGLIIEMERKGEKPFYTIIDAAHITARGAMDGAKYFYDKEGLKRIGGGIRVMGIFSLDTRTGAIKQFMDRAEICNALDREEQARQREDDADAHYGSYNDQHRQVMGDVL